MGGVCKGEFWEAGDDLGGGGLACSVGADVPDEFGLLDVEGDAVAVVQQSGRAFGDAEGLNEAFDDDLRRWVRVFRLSWLA